MQQVTKRNRDIDWGMFRKLKDLDFADELSLLSATSKQMQHKTDKLEAKSGLHVRVSKHKMKVI